MKSLVEQLNGENSILSLQHYEPNDFVTPIEIKTVLDNFQLIKEYFIENSSDSINNIQQFMDYFIAEKILSLNKIIPLIESEENKVLLSKIIEVARNKYESINIGQIICFINENILDVFNEKYQIYGLSNVTLGVMIRFQKGIKVEVFEYLIDNYDYLLIDNYSNFEKLLEGESQLFFRLFKKETIEELLTYRGEEIFLIFANIFEKNNSRLLNIINPLVDKIIKDIENRIKNMTVDNVVSEIHGVKQVYIFLKQIKHPIANTFVDYNKQVEKLLDEYLDTTGQDISYEIPVGQIIEKIKSLPQWERKMLYITHSVKKIDGKISYVSQFAEASKGRRRLMDFASSNIPTDDYFTYSHQMDLEYKLTFGTGTILGIWHDKELFFKTIDWYRGILNYIAKKTNYVSDDLLSDFKLLCTMLQPIIESINLKDREVLSSMCYGAAMFTCALTEKILRLLYINLVKEKIYIPMNSTTLGQLLNPNNQEFAKIFGVDYLKNINYFFGTDEKKKVGKNYRNSLAHWSGMSKEMLNATFVAGLMYLFTDVLNSLFWFFLSKDMSNRLEK